MDAPASVTMILLDRLNTLIGSSSPGEHTPLFNGDLALQNAKQHLLKFVNEMGPTDRIAVYSLGQSAKVLSHFTSDRAQLKTILQTYRATSITSREVAEPQMSDVCPQNDPNGCPINEALNEDRQVLAGLSNAVRGQTTMSALMAIAAHVAGIPAVRIGMAHVQSLFSTGSGGAGAEPFQHCDLSRGRARTAAGCHGAFGDATSPLCLRAPRAARLRHVPATFPRAHPPTRWRSSIRCRHWRK